MSSAIFNCPGTKSEKLPPCSCLLDIDCMPVDKALLAKKRRVYASNRPNQKSQKQVYAHAVTYRYTPPQTINLTSP